MFLWQAIAVMSAVYWFSALLAEILMTSNEERSLAPAIRVGFGFLLSLVYFSAAWLMLSIQQAWIAGLLLLACFAYGKGLFSLEKNYLSYIKKFFSTYLKTFGYFFLGAVVFFLPIIVSNNYGPFTEGGGDISLYSDTAKYLLDNQLTELGYPSRTLSEFMINFKDALWPSSFQNKLLFLNSELINPPNAEYAPYRVLLKRGLSSFFYTPYAAYGLFYKTNYPVYFGIQAFFYICILGSIWSFFRQFSIRIAAVSLLLVISSHGLISVFYNMYSMQANGLAISALIFTLLPSVKLFSKAGFRTYGSALLIIWLIYIHYLAVLLPLIFGITFINRHNRKETTPTTLQSSPLALGSVLIFVILWCFAAIVGATKSLHFAKILLSGEFFSKAHDFLGDRLPIFSFEWLSFLFGLLSQQHYSPFSDMYSLVSPIIKLGIIFGIITLSLGGFIMLRIYFSPYTLGKKKWFYFSLYIISILTIFFQLYVGNSTLYTQAKGAQNVLIIFYVVILLPLAIGIIAKRDGLLIQKEINFISFSLFIFIGSLLITKIVATERLAFSHDRSATLASSYFSEAKKITQQDENAFVLFEPRKSSDVYIGIQPFFGARMVPTRHLILQKGSIENKTWVDRPVLASDLINRNDIPHLWTLNSECGETQNGLQNDHCPWKAQRLITHTHPTLLLIGDDYEKNHTMRNFSKETKETGTFSYLRNGAALLFLPHEDGEIEIVMQPRNENDHSKMVKEVFARVKKGEFGPGVIFLPENNSIKLIYKLVKKENASLKLIARFSGEYWLNVKFNKQEIR